MIKSDAYIVGNDTNCFRCGEFAKIVGVDVCTPKANIGETLELKTIPDWRPCFHVQFSDGAEDWIPISDLKHYEILRSDEIRFGRKP